MQQQQVYSLNLFDFWRLSQNGPDSVSIALSSRNYCAGLEILMIMRILFMPHELGLFLYQLVGLSRHEARLWAGLDLPHENKPYEYMVNLDRNTFVSKRVRCDPPLLRHYHPQLCACGWSCGDFLLYLDISKWWLIYSEGAWVCFFHQYIPTSDMFQYNGHARGMNFFKVLEISGQLSSTQESVLIYSHHQYMQVLISEHHLPALAFFF